MQCCRGEIRNKRREDGYRLRRLTEGGLAGHEDEDQDDVSEWLLSLLARHSGSSGCPVSRYVCDRGWLTV